MSTGPVTKGWKIRTSLSRVILRSENLAFRTRVYGVLRVILAE